MCIISVHVNEYYSVSELWLHTEKCWFMFISEEVVVCPGPRSMWRIEWCTLTLQVPMQPTGLSGRPLSPSFLLMARKRYAWRRKRNAYLFQFHFSNYTSNLRPMAYWPMPFTLQLTNRPQNRFTLLLFPQASHRSIENCYHIASYLPFLSYTYLAFRSDNILSQIWEIIMGVILKCQAGKVVYFYCTSKKINPPSYPQWFFFCCDP